MSLRFKLLLVALSTLALPLAGWLIVRQMEVLLRQGQEQTLIASARALARSLAALKSDLPPIGEAFYVHARPGRIEIDGYADDWRAIASFAQNLGPADDAQKVKLLLCGDADWLYMLVTVRDITRTRSDAFDPDVLQRDHILLSLERNGVKQRYVLASAAPGRFDAQTLDAGDPALPQTLSGAWTEDASGYRVELRIPHAQMPGRLTLNAFDAASLDNAHSEARPLLSLSHSLTHDLAEFAPEGMRVRVLSAEGWVVAESGALDSSATVAATTLHTDLVHAKAQQPASQRRWLENLIYRNLIAPDMTRSQDFAPSLPRLAAPEIWQALSGIAATAWHPALNQDQVVLAAAVPLWGNGATSGEVRGALLLEQSGDALPLLTNRALLLLIGATLIALLFAGAVLFTFASILGLRIRRLRDAADAAIHNHGSGAMHALLPQLDARDELGDLARSFSRLLDEVAAYTHYLRTLASKLSHELQTPLAIVKSSLDNLDHQAVSADARTYLKRARGGAERMGAIVRAMSEAGRMERAIGGAEGEDFDLAAVVRGCVEAYRPLLAPRKITSNVPAMPLMMHGAPELIAQALDKLIDNARSFTPQDGSIALELRSDETSATISVANSGPPLPPMMQERLFDSLVSMRHSTVASDRETFAGTVMNSDSRVDAPHLGLGLYVVRLVAELHRGLASARNISDAAGAVPSGVIFELQLRGMQRRPLAG